MHAVHTFAELAYLLLGLALGLALGFAIHSGGRP